MPVDSGFSIAMMHPLMIAKGLKVGMVIDHQGALWRVLHTQIIAPGNWRAFVQTKMRNLKSGTQTEYRFRTDENVERAILDNREAEFLYKDGESYHFMDSKNYEQFHLNVDILGDAVKFLIPNLKLHVETHDEIPIGVELPKMIVFKVVETGPFMKSATVTNSFKAATLETGAIVQVPGFVEEGESIEVDTTTGEYLGRAK